VNTEEIQNALGQLAETELGMDSGLDAGELADQLDSVGRLTLVVAIEDHFEICFEPEDEEEIRTLDNLVQLIRRKLETR
jgi:acyl carrier protein